MIEIDSGGNENSQIVILMTITKRVAKVRGMWGLSKKKQKSEVQSSLATGPRFVET